MDIQHRFMRQALIEAHKAYRLGEAPVGAVIVRGGKIIARGHNMRELLRSPFAHAEALAVRRAARRAGRWNLHGCAIYVTLEPCLMCFGAIVMANIKEVYFGAYDDKRGCISSEYNCRVPDTVSVSGGILADESSRLLKRFFRRLRDKK